jgi:hypothetical protein
MKSKKNLWVYQEGCLSEAADVVREGRATPSVVDGH